MGLNGGRCLGTSQRMYACQRWDINPSRLRLPWHTTEEGCEPFTRGWSQGVSRDFRAAHAA